MERSAACDSGNSLIFIYRKELFTIFMKHIKYMQRTLLFLCCFTTVFLAGCGKGQDSSSEKAKLTPDDIQPVYYSSEEELPNDMAYIVRTTTEKVKTKDGTTKQKVTRYYPIYYDIETSMETDAAYPAGEDPSRIAWVNYNVDEGYIPTMYPGDELVYKSATYIPTSYSLEKFYDDGYTLGVAKLQQDLSGNYRFDKEDFGSVTMSTSDAVGFSALTDIDSIYLVSVGKERVTPLNVSSSGSVTGLELMKTYECDIRQGTEKIDAALTCNIHLFSSAETYGFGSFNFITPHIARLNVPDYVSTGYYDLNGLGFFRYIAEEDVDYHDLSTEDYNKTIYQYNEDGKLVGTTVGLSFDENGFLVATGVSNEDDTDTTEVSITNKTSLLPDSNGFFSGEYLFTAVGDPTVSGNTFTYVIDAVNTENQEHLRLQYSLKPGDKELETGATYRVMFQKPKTSFDGYTISYIEQTGSKATPVTEDVTEDGSVPEGTEVEEDVVE